MQKGNLKDYDLVIKYTVLINILHSPSSALIIFSDGRYIGAILDRNGLRPARYYTTTDGMIYMSSEVGVIDLPDIVGVKAKGRLKPGRLLIVDTEAGELLNDEQLKEEIAGRYPIVEWIKEGVSSYIIINGQ